MPQRLFNTLTGEVENFTPLAANKVRMYVCGPTVYDLAHIGHARSYVFFDVLRRHLSAQGFDVLFQMNLSDIDEKITAKALEAGRDPLALAEDYIEEFLADMDLLKVKRADIYSRVSDHIGEIVETARQLVADGVAYSVDGSVYFDHRKAKTFGSLTHREIKDMLAEEATDPSSKKRFLLDFSLWLPPKPGDPTWDSPWGKGKPGWHVECYVMSREHLGLPMDIKGGGLDLIYPHHESEAALCEAHLHKKYARYFVHNGFVTIGEAKMSKSARNIVSVREVLANTAPGGLRLWLLSAHYRDTLAWGPSSLKEATARYERMTAALGRVRAWADQLEDGASEVLKPSEVPKKQIAEIEAQEVRYRKAMESDLDTPAALAAMEKALRVGEAVVSDSRILARVRHVGAAITLRVVGPMNETLQILELEGAGTSQ